MTQRLAIVTGSSSGLGLAIAENLLDLGWQVIGVARRDAPLEHAHYRHHRVDLAVPAQAEQWAQDVLADPLKDPKNGQVVLVNNAGRVGPVALSSELSASELSTTFQLNATSPIWLMGYFIASCRGKDLKVANISSGAAYKPYAGWTAYCASKAALYMAGLVAAQEFERVQQKRYPGSKLAIISYSPGVVDTPMQAELRGTQEDHFPDRGRFVGMHESGELVAPEVSAAKLCELIVRDDLAVHSEPRF